MAWNIGLLCIKVDKKQVDEIIPDVFYKSSDGLVFEEVASVSMGKSLGVGFYGNWILIVDSQGRFISDDRFPQELSKKYKVKSFWISESLIYRDYNFAFFKKGGIKSEYISKEGGITYLDSMRIKPIDEWGETMIFQIIEKEIFEVSKGSYGTSLMDLKFDKYELD